MSCTCVYFTVGNAKLLDSVDLQDRVFRDKSIRDGLCEWYWRTYLHWTTWVDCGYCKWRRGRVSYGFYNFIEYLIIWIIFSDYLITLLLVIYTLVPKSSYQTMTEADYNTQESNGIESTSLLMPMKQGVTYWLNERRNQQQNFHPRWELRENFDSSYFRNQIIRNMEKWQQLNFLNSS